MGKYVKHIIVLFLFSCSEKTDISALEYNTTFTYQDIPDVKVNANDNLLSIDNGVIYYGGKPFHGQIIDHYSSGEIKMLESYFEGKKEGFTYSFYKNGDTTYVRPFSKGSKHGQHFGWYKNGQMSYSLMFEFGKSSGEHKTWYKNGQLYKLQHYKNGREYGSQKVWRPDGKIRANYVVRENGKKYGLMGLKRCTSIDTKNEKIKN